MSKDNKNKEKRMTEVFKTLLYIFLIALITYAVMAVITHFSLNFETETYRFRESLLSVFNSKTAIFKFFLSFMILNIIWILFAVSFRFIKKRFFK